MKHDAANAPGDEAAAVAPDDTITLSPPTRWLYVGGVGDVIVDMQTTGAAIVFKAVPAGTLLPIAVTKIRAGTTATFLTAIW